MAVQAGINSTQINDTILASGIAQFIVPTPMSTPLYEVLCMQHDCRNLKSNVLDIPRWDPFPATEETTEGDEVVSVNYATSKKSITGVMYSTRALITDQAIQDSMLLQSDMVGQMAANISNTLDQEGLGLFVGATNAADHSGVNLTIALWQAALAAFRAFRPVGEIAFVASTSQMRDFMKDLIVVGGAAPVAGSANPVFQTMNIDGYRQAWGGVHLFESANITQYDASNDNGGFVALSPTLKGFSMGVWSGIEAGGLYTPHRHGYDTTVGARAGFVRTAEHLVYGFISKKAA